MGGLDNRAMVRAPLTTLVAILLTGAMAACAPALNWRELRFDEAGVTQLFPCKPVRQQRKVELAGRSRVLVLHVCDADGASWALSHLQADGVQEVPALLEAMAASAHANLGATRRPARPQAVPGADAPPGAGRYALVGTSPDGRPLQAAVLLYARGAVVVQLTALGARLSTEAADTFVAAARAGA
jgi:hypothetical protein